MLFLLAKYTNIPLHFFYTRICNRAENLTYRSAIKYRVGRKEANTMTSRGCGANVCVSGSASRYKSPHECGKIVKAEDAVCKWASAIRSVPTTFTYPRTKMLYLQYIFLKYYRIFQAVIYPYKINRIYFSSVHVAGNRNESPSFRRHELSECLLLAKGSK